MNDTNNEAKLNSLLSSAKLISADEANVSPEFEQKLKARLNNIIFEKSKEKPMSKFIKNLRNSFAGKFALAGAGVAIAVIAILGTILVVKPELLFKTEAHLLVAEGTVEYKKFGTDQWQTLTPNISLIKGDEVRTSGDQSRAVIKLTDDSELRLAANSEVRINDVEKSLYEFKLLDGEVFSSVSSNPARVYRITGDDFEVEALGTAFGVKKNSEDKTFKVTVIESKVKIKTEKNGEKQVEEGNTCEKGETELEIKPITEEERKAEFITWNREQELKKKEPKLGILEDVTGPEITITEPSDGSKVDEKDIVVKGKTEAGAIVKINGVDVENKDGSFEKSFEVKRIAQQIEVIAIDKAGNKTVKTINITRDIALSLSGSTTADGVKLHWDFDGINKAGFKVVWNTTGEPVYPGSDYHYAQDFNTRDYTLPRKDGKNYYFRVCLYDGEGKCTLYSNQIQIKAPNPPTTQPASGLSASASALGGGKVKVNWSVSGIETPYGFKIVYDKADYSLSLPTYPQGSGQEGWGYDYKGDPGTRNTLLYLSAGKVYNIRVCVYTESSTCNKYSNNIKLTVQ